jgi:hypothetical protein
MNTNMNDSCNLPHPAISCELHVTKNFNPRTKALRLYGITVILCDMMKTDFLMPLLGTIPAM